MVTRPELVGARLHLSEILALVGGYALASLFFRAFWPSTGLGATRGVAAAASFAWLGLAMSGPLILIQRGRFRKTSRHAGEPASRRTRMETAWCLIGAYWIAIGLVGIPLIRRGLMGVDLLFWVLMFPAVISIIIPPRPRKASREDSSGLADEHLDSHLNDSGPITREGESGRWTRGAAIVVVATWPAAWGCMIALTWNGN